MNKYKRLLSNILTFGIGTFSSKLLVFLLVPLYTYALSTAEYGVTDLIVQTGNLLMPLITVGMASAIIRFGLDKSYRKATVFSTGVFATMAGFCVLLLCWPLLARISFFSDYMLLVYLFVLMSALRSICMQFVRSLGMVKLFAYDGVQCTILTILFNVLYLIVFKLGITGYVLAMISADFCSVVFLNFAAKLWRYVRLSALDKRVSRLMIRFSAPLIPTSLFWWIVNVSDRYMVAYMINEEANGLYAIAYKIPTILSLISGIFIDAWQMSAIIEKDSSSRNDFFTRVFNALASLLFCAASFLILSCRFLNGLLVNQAYEESWQYIPLLVIATAFCCFANFLNSIYMVEKKSVMTLATIIVGAVVNIVLNFFLIPPMGANGAALATFISYFTVFLIRAVTSQKLIRINFYPLRLGVNLTLVGVQCFLMIIEAPHWLLWEGLLFAVVVLLNGKRLLSAFRKILSGRRKPAITGGTDEK